MVHKPLRMPAVIAHRGASAVAPENTLAAFEKAIALGADWIELDVRLTRDGKLAVFHDPDISRFVSKHTPVAMMRMRDLRLLDVGSWFSPEFSNERVCTLEDVFACVAGRAGIYIEIKSTVDETPRTPDMLEVIEHTSTLSRRDWRMLMNAAYRISADSVVTARVVMNAIRAAGDSCRIVAQAFSPIIAAVFMRETPDLRFEFLVMDLPEPPNIWRHYVAFGERIGVAGFNINKESLNEARARHFHDVGATCAVWVVDEPEHIAQCVQCDVDAIITNKPDLCREVLNGLE